MYKRLIQQAFSSNQKLILFTQKDNLGIVELNNPTKRNALSNQMMIEFQDIIQQLQSSQQIHCVILKSASPGMFCAGADLKERVGYTNPQVEDLVLGLRTTFQRWYNLPQPTIALLSGAALGGGLELALACDIRIASLDSIIGLPETALAIIPGAGGTQRLSRIVGLAKAKELIFTAQRLDANQAKEIGLVNYVEKDFELAYKKCQEIAQAILLNGPIGLRCAKKAINQGYETSLETGLQIEGMLYHQVTESKDRLEGLRSFAEKRKPQYKGE